MKKSVWMVGVALLAVFFVLRGVPSDVPLRSSERLVSHLFKVPEGPLPGLVGPIVGSLVGDIPVGDLEWRSNLVAILFVGLWCAFIVLRGLPWPGMAAGALGLLLVDRGWNGTGFLDSASGLDVFLLSGLLCLASIRLDLRTARVYWVLCGLLVGVSGLAMPVGVLLVLAPMISRFVPLKKTLLALAFFAVGALALELISIRSGRTLPGCPDSETYRFLRVSILSAGPLDGSVPTGFLGVLEAIRSLGRTLSWPCMLLGGLGWILSPLSWVVKVGMMGWWLFSCILGLRGIFALGAAPCLAGFWALSSGQTRWPRVPDGLQRLACPMGALVVVGIGCFIIRPERHSKWFGSDEASRVLFREVFPPCVMVGASNDVVSRSCYEFFGRRGLDPSRSGFAVEIFNRAELPSFNGFRRFMEGCHPVARFTPEEMGSLVQMNATDDRSIRIQVLTRYIEKNQRLNEEGALRRRIYWELESPNDPCVASLSAGGLWARVMARGQDLTPCGLEESRMQSLFQDVSVEWPERSDWFGLGLTRWGALQLERRALNLAWCDPIEAFRASVSYSPASPEGTFYLYQVLRQINLPEDALKALQKTLSLAPWNRLFLGEMAEFLENRGDFQAALIYHRRLLSVDRTNWVARLNYATCLASAGQAARALKLYRDLLSEPGVPPDLQMDALRNVGSCLITAGKPEEALASLDKALGMAQDDPELQLLYGQALDAANKPAEAVQVFEKLLEKSPNDPNLCFQLGMAHAHLMHYPESQSYWEKALLIDPSYTEALLNLQVLANQLMYFDPSKSQLPQDLLDKILQKGAMGTPSATPPVMASPSATAGGGF